MKYMRDFFNRINKRDRKYNLKEAIDNMEQSMNKNNIKIKNEIENNIVYEFINLLKFNETNNTKLTIDHVNYNEFVNYFEEKHGIINYINFI